MGTIYDVQVRLTSTGNLQSKTQGVEKSLMGADRAALNLGNSLMKIGHSAMGPIDAVVGKLADVTGKMAIAGLGAVFAGATYGVTKLNAELESLTIGLGTIMNVKGVTFTLEQGMERAGGIIKQMRKDAAELPFAFKDIAEATQMMMVPGLAAGKSPEQVEKFAKMALAAGAIVSPQMSPTVIARQAAMALEGRATIRNTFSHNVLGLAGNDQSKFNKSSDKDRYESAEREILKYTPAIDKLRYSFKGMSETLVDNAKMFVSAATGKLFDSVKQTLFRANLWFDKNQDKIDKFAERVGEKLEAAFTWGRRKIEEWWPAIETFATNAYAKLGQLWDKWGGTVSSFGESLKDFLKAPDSIDKIIKALELYAMIKGVGAVGNGALSVAGVGLNAAVAAKMLGGGAAATGAGAAAAGTGGISTSVAGVGLVGGAAIAAGAAAFVAALGGVSWAAWEAAQLMNVIDAEKAANTNAWLEPGIKAAETMWELDQAGKMQTQAYREAYGEFVRSTGYLAYAGDSASMSLLNVAGASAALVSAFGQTMKDGRDTGQSFNDFMTGVNAKNQSTWKDAPGLQPKTPKHGGGGGGTTVQKVEIVVTSNQNPSRIAHEVKDQLMSLHRNPKVSRGAPSYSGARS